MKNVFSITLLAVFALLTISCNDDVTIETYHFTDDEYTTLTQTLDIPRENFDYTPVTNGGFGSINSSDEFFHKATLGRILFYDPLLSKTGEVSCASCHKQENAFADNSKFSTGVNSQIGTRNSLPLGNTIGFIKYYGTDLSFPSGAFAWDESKASITDQSLAAIVNPVEMNHDMNSVLDLVKEKDYYQIFFNKAYNGEINEANLLDAITTFVNSISSRSSKFDISSSSTFVSNPFPNFTASENNGKQLFNSNCTTCHDRNHNAIVMSEANNGLDMNYADKGVGNLRGPNYNGVFKVPSLRNIELTGPYMHDGRFNTLEEVVEFYSSGIQNHDNLHYSLKSGNQAKKFNFTESQKEDLVAYLKTLTDQELIAEVKYSDPFK